MLMKKITLLLLIMIFAAQLCLAEEVQTPQATQPAQAEQAEPAAQTEPEESYEDVSSYFNTEPEQTTIYEGHLEYNQSESLPEVDPITLQEPTERNVVNLSQPQKIESNSLLSTTKKPTFQPIQDELKSASMFSTQEYSIKPVSTDYSRKFGKFSVGTMYDSGLSKASRNDSTALFAKYEGKYTALSMGFSKSSNYNKDSYEDEFFIAPEIKITNRLSLLDIIETDVYQINKSNEIVLRYTPHIKKYTDGVQFELGAGQSFYENDFIKSSVRFSTKFKL